MPFEPTALPYAPNALEPHLPQETVDRWRHDQRADLDAVNAMLDGGTAEDATLADIVREARGALAARAAQAWSDDFYWTGLRAAQPGDNDPSGALEQAIAQAFGDLRRFRERFAAAARQLPGPGWLWLVRRRDGRLAIVATVDGSTPLTGHDTPLLACRMPPSTSGDDNEARSRTLAAFWPLVDWKTVASRMR